MQRVARGSQRPVIRPTDPGPPLDYARILQLKETLGLRRVDDLLGMDSKNDPFYLTPARVAGAQWFKKIWQRLKLTAGFHIRRIHYILISQDPPWLDRDGKPYENIAEDYAHLNTFSKDARYAGLLTGFVDRRSPPTRCYMPTDPPEDAAIYTDDGHHYYTHDGQQADFAMPELPELVLAEPNILQRYLVEIWVEKSTIDDIIDPIAERYGCNVQTGVGELSEIRCRELVERAKAAGRPVRILYISDFDPGGQSMPVAVARKVEHLLYQQHLDLDIQVRQILLSYEQCVQYQLPRTELKKSETRAAKFEERYGQGATELDAMEAVHPGELDRIIRAEVERYYDDGLEDRIDEAAADANAELDRINRKVHARYATQVSKLTDDFEVWKARVETLWDAITADLEAEQPDIDDIEWPEQEEGDEDDAPLFDSKRDYLTQIELYKKFRAQSKEDE